MSMSTGASKPIAKADATRATVRVQMRMTIAGYPGYTAGEVVDLPLWIAESWIAEGYAVPVRSVSVETRH